MIAHNGANIHVPDEKAVDADCFVDPRISSGPAWAADEHGVAVFVELLAPFAEAVDAVEMSSAHALDELAGFDDCGADLIGLHFFNRGLRQNPSSAVHAVLTDHRQKMRVIAQRAARSAAEHGAVTGR